MNTRFYYKSLVAITAFLAFMANSFAADLSVMHPYARAVAEGQTNSAAFMMIMNNSKRDRALVSARSDASKVVELHNHIMQDGMMRMRQVKQIDIKANGKATLQPGGFHVMLIGLHKQLKEGDKINLELVFDNGQTTKLEVPVKKVAAMMMHHNH